ncbi:hypothetical protein BASA81_007598 [Batrachochytrium salamandrivorans]|nr:hypothetical protein BASA81_007598 [Batrachochytrium salamandrivorans]
MKRPRIAPPAQEQLQVQELRGHLFGDEKAPNKILLRPVYTVFTKLVKESFQSREQKVVIAGSRGIGKSVFGWLMVLEFVLENKIVLYNHRDVMLLVSGETPDATALQEVNQRMARFGFSAIGAEKGVYKFETRDQADLFTSLCTLNLVQLVLDLGDGSIPIPRDGNAPKLILSSPNADKLKTLERHLKNVFYMPVWSWEELKAAHKAGLGVPGESEESLKEGFKTFGGIARTLLQTPKKKREADLKKELNSIRPPELTAIFESMAYHSMPASSGILIHVFPENDAYDDYRCDFASKEMCLQLLVKFQLDGKCTVEKFAADVAGKSSLAAWSGLIFEPMVH